MRNKIVVANWKLHLSVPESAILLEKYKKLISPKRTEVVVCPGFLDIYSATEVLQGTEIGVGAQDAYFEDEGAFTGEVSAHQLKGFAEYVIVGHSERRRNFGETDKIVAQKAAACVRHNIFPIVCVGETLHERLDNLSNLVVSAQVEASLADLTPQEVSRAVIAYEPIWAIGTGKACDPKKALDMIKKIRNLIKVLFGEKVAESVRIIYGGSVDAKNADKFSAAEEIDGLLVGGSSLDAQEFAKIVGAYEKQGGPAIRPKKLKKVAPKTTKKVVKKKPAAKRGK